MARAPKDSGLMDLLDKMSEAIPHATIADLEMVRTMPEARHLVISTHAALLRLMHYAQISPEPLAAVADEPPRAPEPERPVVATSLRPAMSDADAIAAAELTRRAEASCRGTRVTVTPRPRTTAGEDTAGDGDERGASL